MRFSLKHGGDVQAQQGTEEMVPPSKRTTQHDLEVESPEIDECASLPCCVDFGDNCVNMPECVDAGCAITPCCPTEGVEDP